MILPSSFVGGRRYIDQLYFDGMAICSSVGFLDLFLTFTSNPNCYEVQHILPTMNLTIVDRLNIVVREYLKLNLSNFLTNLTKKNKLGKVIACKIHVSDFIYDNKIYYLSFHYNYPPFLPSILFFPSRYVYNKFPKAWITTCTSATIFISS